MENSNKDLSIVHVVEILQDKIKIADKLYDHRLSNYFLLPTREAIKYCTRFNTLAYRNRDIAKYLLVAKHEPYLNDKQEPKRPSDSFPKGDWTKTIKGKKVGLLEYDEFVKWYDKTLE